MPKYCESYQIDTDTTRILKRRFVNIGKAKANADKRKYHNGWRFIAKFRLQMALAQEGKKIERQQTAAAGLMIIGCGLNPDLVVVDEFLEANDMDVKILEPRVPSINVKKKVSWFGRLCSWLRVVKTWKV